jgi:hypothetical protein
MISSTVFASDCGSLLLSTIHAYRNEKIESGSWRLPKKWMNYEILGALGRGSTTALLVRDRASGIKRVVKLEDRSAVSVRFFWREIATTEYFKTLGVPVSAVIDVSVDEGQPVMLMKEYYEGITGLEVKTDFGGSTLIETDKIWACGVEFSTEMRSVFVSGNSNFSNYSDWYAKNKKNLEAQYPYLWMRVLNSPSPATQQNESSDDIHQTMGLPLLDISCANQMVYDFRIGKWVIIDS